MKPEPHMEILQINAKDGWKWIKDGFSIFQKAPLVWSGIFFVYLLISLSLYFLLPLIGLVLFYLVDPLFVAGFMLACSVVSSNQEIHISHLFAAFKQKASRFVTIGGINLVGRMMIVGVMGLLFVNSGYDAYLIKIEQGDFGWLFSSDVELSVFAWLIMLGLLMLPLYMAYWFSPALVEFDDLEPFDAVLLSILGCIRNVKAFLIYGLSFVLVSLGALLVVAIIGGTLGTVSSFIGLGMFFKIFMGYLGLILALVCWLGAQVLIATSQYMSYKAIFCPEEEASSLLAL